MQMCAACWGEQAWDPTPGAGRVLEGLLLLGLAGGVGITWCSKGVLVPGRGHRGMQRHRTGCCPRDPARQPSPAGVSVRSANRSPQRCREERPRVSLPGKHMTLLQGRRLLLSHGPVLLKLGSSPSSSRRGKCVEKAHSCPVSLCSHPTGQNQSHGHSQLQGQLGNVVFAWTATSL